MKKKIIPVVALASCLLIGGGVFVTSCDNTQDTKKTGTVVVSTDNHGTVVASKTSGEVGDEITLTVTPNSGYELDTLTHNGSDIESSKKFTLVEGENKVVATFKETATPTPTTYTVSYETSNNYTVSGLKENYNKGEEVSFSVTVASGYELVSVVVDGATLEPEDGKYSFVMPGENVTLVITVQEETKYTVTYEECSDYTITGLEASYVAGASVLFKVTVNNTSKVLKTVSANGTALTADSEGNYKFDMPSKNTTIVIELKNAIPEGATEMIFKAENDLAVDTWAYWYADWEVACSVNDAYVTKDNVIHYDFSNVMDEKINWHHQLFYKDSSLEAGKYKVTAKITSTAAGNITLNGSTITLVEGENDVDITYNHQTKGGTSFSLQCSLLGTAVLDIANLKYEAIKDDIPDGATAMPWVEEANLVADTWSYYNANWEGGHTVNKAYVTSEGTVHFDFTETNPYQPWLEQIFYKDSSLEVGTKYTFKSTINSTVAGSIIINGVTINLVAGDNDVEVDFTQSAGTTLIMQLAQLGTSIVELKNVRFDAYVAKGSITEGDLPDGVTLNYKIGEENASLDTKYVVGTEVTVTLTDTTDTVEDVLVNNISIKSGDEYKFTIKEGTNKVTVKIKGETVVTKELPIIEKGNNSTKIEGAGIWIYLDNSELGITAANASEFTVGIEVSSKTSSGDDFGASVTSKQFDDYGTNTVRLYILLDKGPGSDFKTTVKITLTHGDDIYEKTTSFTGSKWDDATPVVEPTTYTEVAALAQGSSATRFEGAGCWLWVSTDAVGMTAENSSNYSYVKAEIDMKDAGGAATSAAVNDVIISDHNFSEKYFRLYATCNMAPVDEWTTTIAVYISNGAGVGYKVTASFNGTSLVTTVA